ncbi:hypothetical protein ACE6H2_022030 [Prunus campanulata]
MGLSLTQTEQGLSGPSPSPYSGTQTTTTTTTTRPRVRASIVFYIDLGLRLLLVFSVERPVAPILP